MEQFFKVDEEVIVASPVNREATIEAVNSNIGCSACQNFPTIRYALDIPPFPGVCAHEMNGHWCQCVLRKKHKSGGSFELVMELLKIPNKQTVTVE